MRRLVPAVVVVVTAALLMIGCQAPLARLTFPLEPLRAASEPKWYDVNRNGRDDFSVSFDDSGRVDSLGYDDDEDGRVDRQYRLRDYPNERVPHLVILLDSIPFHLVAERYASGRFRWFDRPAKVIAPFPSMTEVCYSELLHAPPMPGMIDQHYDPRRERVNNGLWRRFALGFQYPWERYLHYRSKFAEEGLAYLDPRPWYAAELERARAALDASPDRTTMVYLTSSSGMACKFGREGIEAVLDGVERLCLQLLYERRGALKISLMADHGHNLVPSKNVDVEKLLRDGGFRIAKRLERPDDVVVEVSGLVTYAAVHTMRQEQVALRLLTHEAVELAMYQQADSVVVRNGRGFGIIEARGDRLRYTPEADVFGYADVLASLRRKGKIDADGFASRDDWFAATVDHDYPDAPARVWDAFHAQVINPPTVMFTTRDGYTAGRAAFERYITMKSTHGSLNQLNTATFLLTMTGRASGGALRTREVVPTIEPGYQPRVRR